MLASSTAQKLRNMRQRRATIMRGVIILLALTFLYLPILTLIVYSFNESRMVTVWTETSLKWYRALFNDAAIIRAVGISLTIAVMTACASVIIGTLAAFVLVRVGRFRGESLFVLLMTAPMVLPEVITGLALLLIFVTLGSGISIFDNRGIIAIWIAHVTFCSAYTTVVIRSRFRELDISIEEAAMDLGAGPIKVFFAVILPALMPAEVAAFLLAFTMSMDDLVITSFIAGPDSTTLPMLIFSSVRRGLSPEINALATIIVLIVSIFTFFAWLSMVKKQKRMKSDAAKAASATAIEQKLHYQAPHGDEDEVLDLNNLSSEALAIFKEQAQALSQGQDIADTTDAKLKALLAARTAKKAQQSNAAVTTSAEAAKAAANTAETSAQAEHSATAAATAIATATASAATASAATATTAATVAPAPVSAAANHNLNFNVRGSAKDVTAAQREVSSSLAAAGMAKVVDADSAGFKPRAPLDADELTETETTSVNTKLKSATTQSSLADAKAKKAALKSALSGVVEKAQQEDESETAAVAESADRKRALHATATTASSLAQAKAKKSKASQSAVEATKLSAEQAKADTDKAKVVDITKV